MKLRFKKVSPTFKVGQEKYVKVESSHGVVFTMRFDREVDKWVPTEKYRRLFLTACN